MGGEWPPGSVWQQAVDLLRYHTGLPRRPCQSRVVEFRGEKAFVELLQEGHPVAVAFTFRCAHTRHLDEMLARASEELHPHVRFVRVECPSHLGFCIARQRKDFPFVEIFHSPKASPDEGQGSGRGREADSIVRHKVTVRPFNNDISPYGFRKYFESFGPEGDLR